MRIAHVIGAYLEGFGYEENCLPSEQARSGAEVWVIASWRIPRNLRVLKLEPDPEIRTISRGEGKAEVRVRRLPHTPEVHGQVALLGLTSALLESNPDIVHVHGAAAPYTMQCLLLQQKLGYKLFVDDHSNDSNFHATWAQRMTYLAMIRAAYKVLGNRVSAFLPITRAAAQVLDRSLNIPAKRMIQLDLGADARVFRPSATARSKFRSKYGLSQDDILVITTGKFYPGRNIDILIRAFASIPSKKRRVILMLGGTGGQEYMHELRALASRLGNADRIVFPGFIPHNRLPEYYNGADIGVWPGEPSITVLEALACGLASILPDSRPEYETLYQHEATATFPRGDASALGRALTELCDSSESREKLSHRACTLVEQKLAWSVISKRTLEIYEGVGLKGSPRDEGR